MGVAASHAEGYRAQTIAERASRHWSSFCFRLCLFLLPGLRRQGEDRVMNDRIRRHLLLFSFLGMLVLPSAVSLSDTAREPDKKTYYSASGEYYLVVDPRVEREGIYSGWKLNPLFTFGHKEKGVAWEKGPDYFEDYRFPLHECVSNDGQYLVFGGVSAHNLILDKENKEGIRIYRADGRLVRFISRKVLPEGYRGASTSDWYDNDRSHMDNRAGVFVLRTPERLRPCVFLLTTGKRISLVRWLFRKWF